MLSACNDQAESTVPAKEVKPQKKSTVYKRSELAQLMRDLYKEMSQVKTSLDSNITPNKLSLDYKTIHTAVPTDADVRDDQFKGMSDALIMHLEKLEKAPSIEVYQNTVDVCLQCHQSYCPGPIKKIKKLKL